MSAMDGDRRTPLRVAYLLGSLRFGGAERHLTHLLRGLDRSRFEPRLYLTRRTGDFLAEVEAMGVPIEESGVRSVFTPAGLSGIARLARRLERDGVDIVHSYLYGANLIGIGVNALYPRAVHLIGIRQQILPRPAVFRALFGVTAGPRTQFVSVSIAADEVLGDWGIDPRWRHRVPNGVELPPAPSSEVRAAKRAELGVAPGQVLIAMVANFHPIKGHAELIEAFASLPAAGVVGVPAGAPRGPMLALVGDGDRMESCRQLARDRHVEDRVLFLGHRADVREILGASDVFVLNSKSEGMSNALLEGLAAGLPCVATDVGGNPELVQEGENGFLVPPRQPAPLLRALLPLVSDAVLRERMGGASRARAVAEYSLEAMVRRTEAIYESVCPAMSRDPSAH
ncbi:MAG: glycosyltransferase [Candidatus Eisenbacteria bacterium]|uniref:Glycosyltransferase n=1 Tax=Eiseniibacteriota bacterium TaxID=2212470 RepID=A0A956RND1_UNCEI|nr:glycosyltransferase [Candidatus Eisenbacteria bacterium]